MLNIPLKVTLLVIVVTVAHGPSFSEGLDELDSDLGIDAAEVHSALGARFKRQADFAHAKDWIKKNLPAYIKKIRIPDYKKKRFWYSYALTGAKVTDFTLPSISFSPAGNDIIAKARGAHVSAKGNYKLRFTFLKSSGTVRVTVRDVSITLRGYYDGKIHIKSCSGSVGDVDVKISSWVLNLFRKYLEKPLKRGLESKICSWTKKFP